MLNRWLHGSLHGGRHGRAATTTPTLARIGSTLRVVLSTSANGLCEVLQGPTHEIGSHAVESSAIKLITSELSDITSYNERLRDSRVLHRSANGTHRFGSYGPSVHRRVCGREIVTLRFSRATTQLLSEIFRCLTARAREYAKAAMSDGGQGQFRVRRSEFYEILTTLSSRDSSHRGTGRGLDTSFHLGFESPTVQADRQQWHREGILDLRPWPMWPGTITPEART